MSKIITNSEVCKKLKAIEDLRVSANNVNSKTILDLEEQIIKAMSFLVYNKTKTYRKFPNYNDLVQEGFVGLIKAVKGFKTDMFPNFFVYASRYIKHSVKRAASRFDVVYDPGRKRVVYADASDGENVELNEDTPESIYLAKEREHNIEGVLLNMNNREHDIIVKSFGLNHCEPQSLRDIGKDLNLTHERVRQIKEKVLVHLKKSSKINEFQKI